MPSTQPKYPKEIRTGGAATTGDLSESSEEFYNDVDSHEERWSEDNIARAIEVWKLNDEEKRHLRNLKHKLSNIQHPKNIPHELVKYIKGPKGHDKAEEIFRNMIEWRREFGTDTILDEYKPPYILYNYIATSMLKGVDYEGDPVYVERAGVVDGVGLVKRFDKEALLKHTVWLRELTASGVWRQDYEREHGHKPRQLTIVFDLHGLSSHQAKKDVINVFKELVSYTADKYYGVSKRMIIIRAPAIFRMVWRIAKNFYDPEVQKKMIFANKDYLGTIDQYMDRDILPPCINPKGHGVTARGFPPKLEGGLIPASLEVDDDEIDTKATQPTYNRSTAASFDSSSDSLAEDEPSSSAGVAICCKPLVKGLLGGDNVTTELEGL